MNRTLIILLIVGILAPAQSYAEVPVKAALNHKHLLASSDPRLAANKKLVYDFFREIIEAGRQDLADKYLAESYIQHNPNVPTGRAGFVKFFSKLRAPAPIEERVKDPLVAVVAEGDLVVFTFVDERVDPKDSALKYTTTWFDMFRIKDGKIVEHWDPARKR